MEARGRLRRPLGGPSSPLYRAVDNVWLEFDVDGAPPVIPIPSVFFGPQPSGQEGARGVATNRTWMDTYDNRDGDTASLRQRIGSRKLEMLSDCFRALSSSEHVFQVGLMLSRGAEAVRLCITIGSVERAVEYLARVAGRAAKPTSLASSSR